MARTAIAPEEALQFNIPYGVTADSHLAWNMHMLVLAIVTAIGAGVFAVILWSLVRHRRSRKPEAARFSGSFWVEIVWTVAPVLILIGIAIPATRVLLIENAHTNPKVTVEIRGSQWKWHYSYVGLGINFFSNLAADSRGDVNPSTVAFYLRDVDHPLILPAREDVQLLITSDDVIHSWWVPELGFKRDVIPGYINRVDINIDQPGVYRGQCASLCGAGHAFMPIVVRALAPDQFQAWVKDQQATAVAQKNKAAAPWTKDLAMAAGAEVYGSICAACHQPDGKGVPGAFPALDGSPVVNGPLAAHLKIVVHGSTRNPAMAAWGKQLDNRQIAGVITYERNSWGNHTGTLVTPEQVETAR
ncbi:cytochrome c oxidase subunit II [Rhodoblastus sp.]|uniref:cytochrome c oxidase subunit II n=1 Tax=Rhodoblastus sp. TaxID=1962975 RepID=UPI0026185A64|nr:cytochrome c oxidase subunit II [Rhodoblastus sp.]